MQSRLRYRLGRLREAAASPKIEVGLYGSQRARSVYDEYTAAHPQLRVIPYKRWGVALLPVPDTFEQYLQGKDRRELRSKRARALRRGFRFAEFDAREHVEDILEVNWSAPERQGRPMLADYLDEPAVRRYCERNPNMLGILDADGRVRAWCDAPVLGELGLVARLLGHADHLRDGIMYLLVSETVGRFIRLRAETGQPQWIEYGTFWSSSPGMATFKERTGFQPYRVDWQWREVA